MKRRLSSSLLFYDLIIMFFIFISVILTFEVLIKRTLVNYGSERFTDNMAILDYELSDAITSLEKKTTINYKDFLSKTFEYLKLSSLKRTKYDESIVLTIFPDGTILGGKKNNPNYNFNKKVEYKDLLNKIDKADLSQTTLIDVNVGGEQYIGVAKISSLGIRKNFDRNSYDIYNPILLIADKKSDFFYLIDLTRLFFLIWLFIIVMVLGLFKFRLTSKATGQIKEISKMLKNESENIRTKGIIGKSLIDINSEFIEVINLNKSSQDLNEALIDLKKVVLGVTNEEFFIGTITNDEKIIEQHEISASIMFVDIKGFTTISENHKENSMKIGIDIFTKIGEVLSKYNGNIRKLLGDAALIAFKDKDCINSSGINALKSAIEIINSVSGLIEKLNKKYNPQNIEEKKITFNFRIGIDSGRVHEGLFGTKTNFEYGIIGDAVNTASRFEALNKQYNTNILLSENAYNEIIKNISSSNDEKDAKNQIFETLGIEFFTVDEARVKGKVNPSKIFTVTGVSNKNICILGNDICYQKEIFDRFNSLIKDFKDSIKDWKKFIVEKNSESKKTAISKWNTIVKEFAGLSYENKFLVTEQFIKLMLTNDEFNEYKLNYNDWIKKDTFDFQLPSLDWVNDKHLTRELDK